MQLKFLEALKDLSEGNKKPLVDFCENTLQKGLDLKKEPEAQFIVLSIARLSPKTQEAAQEAQKPTQATAPTTIRRRAKKK